MKKEGSIILMICLFFALISTLSDPDDVDANSATIIVPNNFPTIQEAINNAVDGDVIFIKIGTYFEHVVVNKTVSLLGETRDTTIVDGNWTGITINVAQNGVTISNLTVQRSGFTYWESAGIFLDNVENCTVSEAILTANPFAGLMFNWSRYCIVSGNHIHDNGGVGVTMVGSSFNNLSQNTIARNGWSALTLNEETHHNTISENSMISNNLAVTGHCINLYRSEYNLIQKNNITGDDNGIRLEYWSNYNTIANNSITENSVSGLSIEMYSANNLISQNTISKNGFGFYVLSSGQNTISRNNVVDNDQQVYVSSGSVNNWDGGHSVGGNYWSGYISPDLFSGPYQNITGGDGIGDDPYVIDAYNRDNYPFMLLGMCNVSQIPQGESILPGELVKINATITHLYSVERATLNYTIANSTGEFGFSQNMTNAEGDVWNATIPAFPAGTNVTYIIVGQDSEGNTISSQQQGYTLEYQVVPEFSLILVLLLLTIMLLSAALISKRKGLPFLIR